MFRKVSRVSIYGSDWILNIFPTDAYGAKSISDSLAVEILSFTSTA